MIYHQRDKYRRRNKIYFTTSIVGAIVLFVIVANIFFPHFLTPAIQLISIPTSQTQDVASDTSSGIFGLVRSKYSLVMQNRTLKQQVVTLEALRADRTRLLKENEQLQGITSKATSTKAVIAKLISKPGFSPYDTVVINRGQADSVRVGDLVLVEGVQIVGEISDVSAMTSTVVLYSSANRKTNVLIGDNAIEAVATGKGGGNFELKLPRNTTLNEGDSVVLAAHPDKTFGVIEDIHTDPSDSFENILFRNPVDVSNVKFVTIEQK